MTMLSGAYTSLSGTPDRNVDTVIMQEFTSERLYYQAYFSILPTDKEQIKVAAFGGFGAMPQLPEGTDIAFDASAQRFTYTSTIVDYALAFKVSRQIQRSDEYGLVPKWARALGMSAAETLRVTHSNILNRAFSSSYTFGDGKALCTTDHPTAGSTAANEPSVAADIANASLDAAMVALDQQVDYRGLHAGCMGTLLVVNSGDKKLAWQMLNSVQEQGTTDNQDNYFRGRLNLAVDPTLTDADAWWLIDERRNPLQSRIREPLTTWEYNDEGSRSRVHCAAMALTTYATDWMGIYGSPGA